MTHERVYSAEVWVPVNRVGFVETNVGPRETSIFTCSVSKCAPAKRGHQCCKAKDQQPAPDVTPHHPLRRH